MQRTYTYGLQRVNQNQIVGSAWTPKFYGYDGDDGGSSVRTLTDSTGTVTDTYDYDAWGNAVNTTGSTPNVYLYRGEQYDADLGLYYLRARYFNPVTGRFLTPDPFPGDVSDPATLHRYLYAVDNPINRFDPTGWQSQSQTGGTITPEAGGYIHLSIGPLQWLHVDLTSTRDRIDNWRDPNDPRCGTGASGSGGGGSAGGVKICSRAGWQDLGPGGIANHVYLWDPAHCSVCGRGNDSYAGNENPKASGTACVDVPGSVGKEAQIMKCCQDTAYKHIFFPFVHDCHNAVDDCIKAAGLTPPPHPGGRFGARCSDNACQPGPWFPGCPWGPRPGPFVK